MRITLIHGNNKNCSPVIATDDCLSMAITRRKVFGGPGCGKTYAIKADYVQFLENGYTHDDITVLTFRKNAADDLVNATIRYAKVNRKELVHVGTIHSICNRLTGRRNLMDPADYRQFIKENGYEKYTKPEQNNAIEEEAAYSGDMFDLYTWCRNTLTPFEMWKTYPGNKNIKMPSNMVPEFFKKYDEFKQKIEKIDYSDMLQTVLDKKIMLDTPILIVDEFQDFTAQMYKIFEMWEKKCEYVVIAGDPNQSIYGFWGGSPNYYIEWEGTEVIRHETFRLPEQIKDCSHKLLKWNKMSAPETKAKRVEYNPIIKARYNNKFPEYGTEFHLVRCNYQADPLAGKLADEGRVFSGLRGWTESEINIANAIIALRNGSPLSLAQVKAVIDLFPLKLLEMKGNKEDIKNSIERTYKPQLNTGNGIINEKVLNILQSPDPVRYMLRTGKLFRSKIAGIRSRQMQITKDETENRKILTIHGAKGLEADAVFLHLGITPKIQKAIMIPGADKWAEARVWYVGMTRPRKMLYLISDAGTNYPMPNF